jgi:hypothetical protein
MVTAWLASQAELAPDALLPPSLPYPAHHPLPVLTHVSSPPRSVRVRRHHHLAGNADDGEGADGSCVSEAAGTPWTRALDASTRRHPLEPRRRPSPPQVSSGRPRRFLLAARSRTGREEDEDPPDPIVAAWPAWPRRPCKGLARLGPSPSFYFYLFFSHPSTWTPTWAGPTLHPCTAQISSRPCLLFKFWNWLIKWVKNQ